MLSFFTGDLDAAYVGVTPFVLGRSYGLPIQVIGVAQRLRTSDGLVVREPAFGRNLRVGTVLGSTGHMLTVAHAEATNTRHSCINLDPEDQVRAFAAGFVDAVACWDPYLALAEQAGGQRVFTSEDADFPLHNLIVAREEAIATQPDLLLTLLDVHHDVSTTLAEQPRPTDLEVLSALQGERLEPEAFGRILADGYEWPGSSGLDAASRESVQESIRAALAFLQSIGLVPETSTVTAADCLAQPAPHPFPRPTAQLQVGYSDDLMCAAFHLALHHGYFSRHGVEVEVDESRKVERIAHFDLAYRTLLAELETLMTFDPEAAVVRIGRASEDLFQRIFEERLRTQPPTQLSKTLSRLHEMDLVPSVIATSAHWIRSIRNVAAHGEGVTRSDADKAYFHLVDVLAWWHQVRDQMLRVCVHCSKALAPEWRNCPHCGASGSHECGHCGAATRPDWRNCPHCGTAA